MSNQGNHPRTLLNTVGQQRRQTIRYETNSTGPQNNPTWTATVYIGDMQYGQGQGLTKGQAQDAAAQAALDLIAQGY
ncbi:Ribonuclease 3 [Hypsizygus marmoreus]|uniref:Ribonuclease 3 n=1 Tax=Hypsizygus marmoreus TaxID=39966 RepID=A0A369K9T9_HYPMA|nr:Ribonuclease 3 [Hypsizygus marmoreus]